MAPAFAVFCDTIVKIVYWTEQGCIREAEIIPVEQKVIAGSGETIAENTKAAWNAKVVLRKAQTENSATK